MMSMRAAIAAGCLLLFCGTVQAAVVGQTYTFYATFSSGPYASISGMFDASFAPGGTATLSDFTSTLPVSYQDYEYISTSQSEGIGNTCAGATCSVSAGHDTFAFSMSVQPSDLPSQVAFSYSSAQSSDVFAASAVVFSLSDPARGVPAVPLPASAPLFGAALLAVGAVGHRQRRNVAAG